MRLGVQTRKNRKSKLPSHIPPEWSNNNRTKQVNSTTVIGQKTSQVLINIKWTKLTSSFFTGSDCYSYVNGFCYDLNWSQIVSFKLKPTGCDSDFTNVPLDQAGISKDQIEPLQA